jgi:hypothetical protein
MCKHLFFFEPNWIPSLYGEYCMACGGHHHTPYNTIQYMSLESVLYCQIEVSASADHSSRGVLPSVACLSFIAEPQQWGSLGPLGRAITKSRNIWYVVVHLLLLSVLKLVVGFVMVGIYYCPSGRYNFSLHRGSFLLKSIQNFIVAYFMRIIQMDIQFNFLTRAEFFNGWVNVSLARIFDTIGTYLFQVRKRDFVLKCDQQNFDCPELS